MAVVTSRNPKGAGRKSTRAAVEERRSLILEALKAGRYFGIREDLAERFQLSPQQITEDIKAVFRELREQRLSDAEDVKEALKLKLHDVEMKARWGWDHSVGKVLKEMVEQITQQVQEALSKEEDVPTEFHIKLKSAPDRGFLDTILKCIDKEAQLEGVALDKPTAVVNVGMDWDALAQATRAATPEQVIDARLPKLLSADEVEVRDCSSTEGEETLLQPPVDHEP